jgi:YD repeat-containing protein
MDLKTAFLQGESYDSSRDVYCELPKEAGLPWYMVARMKKPAYGLNDAPRRWWNVVDGKLRTYGLMPTRADRCTYVLYSNDRGIQTILKEKTGYKRASSDGKTDYFDNSGKLSKISDKNGYSVMFEYKGEQLYAIKDTQAKQILFDWYPDGKIKSASFAGDKKATYTYDTKGNLATSTDVNGNIYKYEYDSNHNLTTIGYIDTTKLQVKYDKNSFATEVIERTGESTKYKYENNPKNPDFHYWTTVSKKPLDGAETSSRYEYEIKTKPTIIIEK